MASDNTLSLTIKSYRTWIAGVVGIGILALASMGWSAVVERSERAEKIAEDAKTASTQQAIQIALVQAHQITTNERIAELTANITKVREEMNKMHTDFKDDLKYLVDQAKRTRSKEKD